jgi:hypothetical protein
MSNKTLTELTESIDNQILEVGLSMIRQPETLSWVYELDTENSIILEGRINEYNRLVFRVETFSVDSETGEDTGNVFGMFDNMAETLLCVIKERSKIKLNA